MINLDASVSIAHFSALLPHPEQATKLLRSAVRQELTVHPLTLAEILLGVVRDEHAEQMLVEVESLGIRTLRPDPDEPLQLATLRVRTSLKLPDCCSLTGAMQQSASLVTFNQRLAAEARRPSVPVVPNNKLAIPPAT